jgi:hypothetical protein
MAKDAHIDAYIRGVYEDDLFNVVKYEEEQFKSAFSRGTRSGWAVYRRNVMKRVADFNNKYGIEIESDVIMSGECAVWH